MLYQSSLSVVASKQHPLVGRADLDIEDLLAWPWVLPELQGQNLAEFPNLKAWMERVGARPAVIAGRALGDEMRRSLASSGKAAEAARKVLFGQRAR